MSQEFDYIIIGAGSAGNTLATRLTEDEGVTVLLVRTTAWTSARKCRPPWRFRCKVVATTGPTKPIRSHTWTVAGWNAVAARASVVLR